MTRSLVTELFVRPLLAQRRRLAWVAGSLAVLAVSQGLFLLTIKGFVKALFQDVARPEIPLAELVSPRVLELLAPTWQSVSVPQPRLAVLVPLVILAAGVMKAVATYLYQLNQQALALAMAKSYRDRLFAALVALPFEEIRRRPAGEWMSLIMNDVLLLQARFSDVMTAVVKDTVLIVACFVVLAFVHWPTAVALMALSPVVAFGMGRTGKRIAFYTEAFQRELAGMAGAVLDMRARFDFIRSQRGEKRERARFGALTLGYYRMIRRSIMIRSAFAPVLEFLGFAVFAGFVWAIGNGYWGDFTPDVMMQFFVALGLLLRPLREMGEQISRYHETKGSLAASLATFRRMEELAAQKGPRPAAPEEPAKALPTGGLQIARIEAGFGGEAHFTADGLSFLPGRSIAVIGPSGAGKSTLLKTLAGLVEPRAWKANVGWDEAVGLVSMVSQDPFLFDDTIAANLAYGSAEGHEPGEDELWESLRKVNIDGEIAALPKLLQTHLRAVGTNVSGGQLQRLVIARGMLRPHPLWLLDEATSAVDAQTEKDITLRLIAACRAEGKALVAVTHRLTWLEAFDEVWFVEQGRRTFAGPHQALLAEPRYKAFCAAAGGEGAS